MLMVSAMNYWVIYKDLHCNSKVPFLDYLVDLAESLIKLGEGCSVGRKTTCKKVGRPSVHNRKLMYLGKHFGEQGKSR